MLLTQELLLPSQVLLTHTSILKIHSSLQQDFADSMFRHMGKEDPHCNNWKYVDGLGTLRKFSNVLARKLSI